MNPAEYPPLASELGPGKNLGHYELVAEIQSGGMGRVFLAIDGRSGHRVAIKALLSRDAVGTEFFRREIETLSTLHHPAIVPFREHGVSERQPWYAMDLLEGCTLRDVLKANDPSNGTSSPPESWVPTSRVRRHDADSAASARPAPRLVAELARGYISVEEQLDICAKVFEALAHVHALGLVHADIKPENIFLCQDLQPVLVDFGLVSCFDAPRERLALVPRSLGSVAYMAPERLRGALPDARADLYAMGCILYECLTGQHPFRRDTIEATTLAHLRVEVIAPSRFRPELPRQLDALVLRLLAKSADDRLGYAKDALEVLAELASSSAVSAERPPQLSYLYRAPLVGRSLPLERLHAALDAAESGRGAGIAVCAASGLGKTRLVLELVDVAVNRGATVFHLECAPPAAPTLQPWLQPLQALLRMLDEHGSAAAERDTNGNAPLRRALDELVARQPSRSPDDAEAAARERLLLGLTSGILAVCATNAVLLVVDDVERADDLTLELVQRTLRNDVASKRLLVVVTQGTADARCEALDGACEELLLQPLGEGEVDAMVRAMLALEHPAPTLIHQAHQVCEGNPAILGHYLRALIAAGVLRRNRHQGWYLDSPLEGEGSGTKRVRLEDVPVDTLSAVFEWRIAALSPAELRTAATAALLDVTFDLPLLAKVARAPLAEISATLAALCRHQILERQAPDRYRFTHRLLCRALDDRLEREESRRLRRRAAAVLWAERSRGPTAPGVLAVNLSLSGSHKKAAACFAAAAKSYVRAYRRQDALDSFRAAIAELLKTESASSRLSLELAELHEQAGDVASELRQYATAQDTYRQALPFAISDGVTLARLHRKLAGAFQRDYDRSLAHLKEAIASLETADRSHSDYRNEWLQVNLDTMWVHYWKQETANLLAIAEAISAEVEQFGTERQRASLHFNLSVGLMQRNRYVTSATELEHVERALRLYEELESRPNVAMCRFVRSMILLLSNQLVEAEAGFEAVLAISEKATSVTIRIRALTFLCILHRKNRSRERVRKLASAAYSLASAHHMLEYQGTAMANLAWVAFHDGAFAECERLARAAVVAWDASPLNVFRWTALLPLMATVLNRPERASDAAELVDIAERLLHLSQQLLPASLSEHLEQLRSDGASPAGAARDRARLALESAENLGLM
jgi:eukaryotic-like serine/threonine-protein kinase